MKKMLIIMMTLLLGGNCAIPVHALETEPLHIEKMPGNVFVSFVENSIISNDFQVYNSHSEDVTKEFIKIYYAQGIDAAYRFIQETGGRLESCVETVNENDIMAVDESIGVTKEEYWISWDTKHKFRKEWKTRLSGTYYYNVNAEEIRSAKKPYLTLEYANFGYAFSPYMNNVSTSYTINSSRTKVTFTGTYHMYADIAVTIQNLPVGYTLDFYSHTQTIEKYA